MAEIERLDADGGAEPSEVDYDCATMKILHLARGPLGLALRPPVRDDGGASSGARGAALEALRGENAALREQLGRCRRDERAAAPAAPVAAPGVGDLERQQAVRQLERFKKATKKYVKDFREGIYGLLGWRVEMKGEGSQIHWHLTSRFQGGQVLIFQLRPAEVGLLAEFDLLCTPWAEQLQDDREAMAYLEVYQSIPGFLAHLTADLLTRQTLTG